MKKLGIFLLSVLLVLCMTGCSAIRWFFSDDAEKAVITPANPHAAADYGNGIYYFWDDFQIALNGNSVILALSGLDELGGFDFQVTYWNADATVMNLVLEGSRAENDADGNKIGTVYCRIKINYRPDLTYSQISSASLAAIWPDTPSLTMVKELAHRKMINGDGAMYCLGELDNGKTLEATIWEYTLDAGGNAVTYDLYEDPAHYTAIQNFVSSLFSTDLSVTIAPDADALTALVPTKLCFWTKELALSFPCTFLSSVADGVVEWTNTDATTGKETSYSLMREPQEEAVPEGQLSAKEYYTANLEGADAKMKKEFGTAFVARDGYYLFCDSTTGQLYRLTVG